MYVIGSEAYPTNPVQDWKDGKLAIQVPEGGNDGASGQADYRLWRRLFDSRGYLSPFATRNISHQRHLA